MSLAAVGESSATLPAAAPNTYAGSIAAPLASACRLLASIPLRNETNRRSRPRNSTVPPVGRSRRAGWTWCERVRRRWSRPPRGLPSYSNRAFRSIRRESQQQLSLRLPCSSWTMDGVRVDANSTKCFSSTFLMKSISRALRIVTPRRTKVCDGGQKCFSPES